MKECSLKEVQDEMFNLALVFHNFCELNNLEYSICGGTLIGSVRHKGFIPWDDDFDVIMPRKDFNRFLTIWSDTESSKMISTRDKKYYKVTTPAKIYNPNTRVSEINELENGMPEFNLYGLFIDIFPVDTYSNSMFHKLINKYWGKILLAKALSRFPMYKKNNITRLGLKVIYFIPNSLFLSLNKIIESSLNKDEFNYIGYGYETPFSNLWAKKEKIIPFERSYKINDKVFFGPVDYNIYLTQRFGDYMKLPQQKDRKRHIVKVASVRDLEI